MLGGERDVFSLFELESTEFFLPLSKQPFNHKEARESDESQPPCLFPQTNPPM